MAVLHERLVRGASEFPRTPFIVEAETGRTLTYAGCAAAVRALRLLIGIEPRAIVMALPSGATGALLWLSALTGGHTLAPLPPDAGVTERRRAVQLVRPQLLIVERAEDAAAFACPDARILTQQECERAIAAAFDPFFDPSHTMTAGSPLPAREGRVCLMTSGSTGEPKGVFLTEARIAWTANHIRESHCLTAADRGLTVLPFFHVNAPVVSLCTMLLAGGTVVIARRFSRTRFWDWIERYQITWASLVPTVLAMLLDTDKPVFLPGRLRFVRTASAPLPVVHLLAFERRFGIPVVETYGLSEAAATVSATPVPPALRKPGSVGLPVGVELRVCRPRAGDAPEPLVDVANGAPGEICVRGPSVISGYAGGASAAVFQDGWFRTGDLGYRDADGYLYITGRMRDVIIRGGENIAPREVEEVLLADPAVRDVAVVGRSDPLYGQQVVAYVVPEASWTAEREQEVRARCAGSLAAFKMPESFIPVARLPRTRSGKIQRHRLAALSGLPRISLLAGMLSSGRWRQSVTDGVASVVTTTMARIQRTGQRARLAMPSTAPSAASSAAHARAPSAMPPMTRPVKLAVESSPHHVVLRATAPRPAVLPDARTRPVAAVSTAERTENAEKPGAARRTRRPYMHELDPIRITTALAVVGVHVLTFAAVLNTTHLGVQIQIGVGSALHFTREIFMFTTAFVLVYTYAGVRFDLKSFIRKRGIGVVVPYAIWTLIYLWLNRTFSSPGQFTLSALKALLSGNASYQLYYILLTIQFYLLFPLLLLAVPWIRRHQRLVLVTSCALELLLLGLDYTFVQAPPLATTRWGTLLNNYQDRFLLVYQFYFILGTVAALNVERVRALLRDRGAIIVAAAIAALALLWTNYALAVWWLHQPSDYASSVLQPELLPYSLAVLAMLGWLACRWAARRRSTGLPRAARFWRTLADSAFGIYLIHPLVLTFALQTIAPALPTAIPVAVRVGLLWALVGSLSTASSVLLMKTPVVSRLVGRQTSLPALGRIGSAVRSLLPSAKGATGRAPAQQPRAAGGRKSQQAYPLPNNPYAGTLAGAAGVGSSGAARQSATPAPAYIPAARSYPRSVARETRPLASVPPGLAADISTHSGIEGDLTAGHMGKEDADVVPARDLSRDSSEEGQRRAVRERRRRRASELREGGWKQKDIAAELGVSASTVSGWLRREREEGVATPDAQPARGADVVGEDGSDDVGGAARTYRAVVANELR